MDVQEMVRLFIFGGGFVLFAALERVVPWRGISHRGGRWLRHFLVIAAGTLCTRLLLASGALGASAWAASQQVGLMHWLPLPFWLDVCIGFLLLDGVIYWQHRLFHRLPWLWWFHRYHHQDVQLDVSSALRFHPVEIVLSMMIKILAVVVLGAPVVAVLVFEVVLNFVSMFNHADWRLPREIERVLRYVVVTPDMHRVHHSVNADDMSHNFGFNFSFWDRLFGSYRSVHTGDVLLFGVLDRKR